jgi:hypothetical protein
MNGRFMIGPILTGLRASGFPSLSTLEYNFVSFLGVPLFLSAFPLWLLLEILWFGTNKIHISKPNIKSFVVKKDGIGMALSLNSMISFPSHRLPSHKPLNLGSSRLFMASTLHSTSK